jgi:4-diphosphocytidyl-2-C-methyl-D-erythritol kinase
VRNSQGKTGVLSVAAYAKINLTLRITERRGDGYHGLRTVFQSIALHDRLTFEHRPGAFRIETDQPDVPVDETNLVSRAAGLLWKASGHRGEPCDVTVRLVKRIPMQSGLGGGSSDAAAAIRALARLWRVTLPEDRLREIAARIGADVPFFFEGGTALGLGRGDLLFPLIDAPPNWVALVVPPFGVSTRDAYGWFDRAVPEPSSEPRMGRSRRAARTTGAGGGRLGCMPPSELRNDLEPPVAAHHPEIGRIGRALRQQGASYAAMSGSGSVVFGLFETRGQAVTAAARLATAGRRAIVTRTLDRANYLLASQPVAERGVPRGRPMR